MDRDVGRAQTGGVGVKIRTGKCAPKKKYHKLLRLALSILLASVPMHLALADGLQPCDSRSAGLRCCRYGGYGIDWVR